MHWSWLLFFLKLKASFYVPELGARVFKGISIKQALALLDWAPGSRGIGWNSQGSLLNSWCSCLGDLSRTWLGPEKADQNLAERCFVLKSEESQILTSPTNNSKLSRVWEFRQNGESSIYKLGVFFVFEIHSHLPKDFPTLDISHKFCP